MGLSEHDRIATLSRRESHVPRESSFFPITSKNTKRSKKVSRIRELENFFFEHDCIATPHSQRENATLYTFRLENRTDCTNKL